MRQAFPFTWANLRTIYEEILGLGYRVITCSDYFEMKKNGTINGKLLVNRVDIDSSCRKARRMAEMFNHLDIKGAFFVRLHADEYNPFSFENYRCLRFIRDSGHEIGYHSEVIDQAAIWDEDASECMLRDIELLKSILHIEIRGTASHGGMTGLNNLQFWKDRKPSDFGLLYEAYDTQPGFNLFNDSLYLSDSNWTHWKCYVGGQEIAGDHRTPSEHARAGPPLIYLLVHGDTYYDTHFYE